MNQNTPNKSTPLTRFAESVNTAKQSLLTYAGNIRLWSPRLRVSLAVCGGILALAVVMISESRAYQNALQEKDTEMMTTRYTISELTEQNDGLLRTNKDLKVKNDDLEAKNRQLLAAVPPPADAHSKTWLDWLKGILTIVRDIFTNPFVQGACDLLINFILPIIAALG